MNIEFIFIDDEEDILNLIRLRFRKLLKESNIILKLFPTSLAFEKHIKETKSEIVVVVSDINMPNNKVLKTLEGERRRFKFSMAYLCSAYDKNEYKDLIEMHEIIHFFKKPLNIESIKDKIINDLTDRGVKI